MHVIGDDDRFAALDRLAGRALAKPQRMIVARRMRVVAVEGDEQVDGVVPDVEGHGVAVQQLAGARCGQLDQLGRVERAAGRSGQLV